jgi:hypothetical protein
MSARRSLRTGVPDTEVLSRAEPEDPSRKRLWKRGLKLAEERMDMGAYLPLLFTIDEHGIPLQMGGTSMTPMCVIFQNRNAACQLFAGHGTQHPGTGPCYRHGGNAYKERVGGAFMTAHAIAAILDVDPWEAVEVALRRAYAWSSWYNAMLATVEDNDDLRPGGKAHDWVKGAERTTEYVVRYAKIAHDMGIAERRMDAIELEGQLLAQLLATTLHELGLTAEMEDRARAIMDVQLRKLAQEDKAVVIGELAP